MISEINRRQFLWHLLRPMHLHQVILENPAYTPRNRCYIFDLPKIKPISAACYWRVRGPIKEHYLRCVLHSEYQELHLDGWPPQRASNF